MIRKIDDDPVRPVTDNSKLINVTIFLQPNRENKRRDIRCLYCGLVIMQATNRDATKVFEGIVVQEKDQLISRCARCRTVFAFIIAQPVKS